QNRIPGTWRNMKTKGGLVALAILLTALISACGGATAAPPSSAAASLAPAASTKPASSAVPKASVGTLTMGQSNFASALMIPAGIGPPTTLFNWAAFDGLTVVDRDGKAQPDLASSWSSEDTRTWTFRLRSDIKFQDGTPFDSSDVVGTFNWYKNPA